MGMEKPAQNIQDSFLNNARKDKVVLTIYLMSGVKLSGRIKSFESTLWCWRPTTRSS